MQIPVENIYYLLCYAWNKLEEKDRVQISVEASTSLLDLFAKVLINAARILLKRGIDKNYMDHTEERAVITGKIDLSETLKRRSLSYQRAICTFDEFSAETLLNRILVSTMYRLTRTNGLDPKLHVQIISLLRMLSAISPIEVKSSLFQQVRLHRNNRFYEFVLSVCRIVHESTLPSERKGEYVFSDFSRNENKMNQLFEAFVRNFYRIEQSVYTTVKREYITWQLETEEESAHEYLPRMETDITLENDTGKIVIDTKFYRDTMVTSFGQKRINSGNLYQLYSYLMHQETKEEKTRRATGILLYPTVDADYDLCFNYRKHPIQIKTVNLNQQWIDIDRRLKDIIAV
jgi:5-methylcytosine-specific restriction enzyme subunit McrC